MLETEKNICVLQLAIFGSRVEAGSNTRTVTLRVVGSGERGSLKYERVKCGHE
jgi:hypothetical protein